MNTCRVADFGFDPVHRTVWVELDGEPGREWAARLSGRGGGCPADSVVAAGRHLYLQRDDLDELDMLTLLTAHVARANRADRQARRPGP